MTDFNALSLTEQLKALEPGDELHLRGGGWLPFCDYYKDEHDKQFFRCVAHTQNVFPDKHDIIRVIRPSARKVPEVSRLRLFARNRSSGCKYAASNWDLADLATALADHFESEAKP